MFNFAGLVAFVSLAIAVSGVPLEIRQNLQVQNIQLKNVALKDVQKNINEKGAVYFITNEDTGNFVVAMNINPANGQLKLARAISTGGQGNHGQAKGPDALFSQGAVKASVTGQFLVAVNSGSNTLSMFSIDPKNPTTLKLVGGPTSSEGEFPVSVAINKAGTVVCALNGGQVNNVQCFDVDKKKGLRSKKNTRRSLKLVLDTSPTGPANTVSHVIFSDDEKTLLASIKGDGKQKPGFIASWDINNGQLSKDFKKIAVPDKGNLPFGMAAIPGKNAVIATDAALGFNVLDFGNTGNGNNLKFAGKSSSNAVNNQKAVCWVARSKKTGNFMMSDIGTSMITEVNIDDNLKAKVVKQFPLDANSSLLDLDTAQFQKTNTEFLYVLAAGKNSVDVLQINGSGDSKKIQTLDIAAPAKKAGLKINPDNMMGMTAAVFTQ